MNGEPLDVLYGAPPRLRNELVLGFKQVKWIQAIEFAESRPPRRPGPPQAPGTRPGRQPAGSRCQPSPLLRDTDMTRIVRRSGGTIALNGVPLTTAGWRRVQEWRREWLALPSLCVAHLSERENPGDREPAAGSQ